MNISQLFKTELLEFYQILIYFVPKLISATICGAIIGLEREQKHAHVDYTSAGLKTISLICASACLFASVSILISQTNAIADPSRIISYIISGISFIGAGVIFKDSDKVRGATTAALIWVTTAIGIVVGIGYIYVGPVLAIGFVIATRALTFIERLFRSKIDSEK